MVKLIEIIVLILCIELFIRVITDFKYGLSTMIMHPYRLFKMHKNKESGYLIKVIYDKLNIYSEADYILNFKLESHRLVKDRLALLCRKYNETSQSTKKEFDECYFESIFKFKELLSDKGFNIRYDEHWEFLKFMDELIEELKQLNDSAYLELDSEIDYIKQVRNFRNKL